MNDNGAKHLTASRLLAAVQAIVRERLASDPQRFERVLADVEAAAWAEVEAMFKESMKAAIIENLLASRMTLSPSASNLFVEPPLPSPAQGFRSETDSSEAEPTDAEPPGVLSTAAAHIPASSDALSSTDIDIVSDSQIPSATIDDEGVGVYVYGVIARDAAVLPEIAGIADGSWVRLHEYGGLAAVVSDVPLCEFGQSAIEAHLSDLEWLEKSVRRHQAVLDQVLALTTLAPMKFATIYLDAARLERWLDEQQTHLSELLAGLRNRQEWGLKLLVDRKALAEHVAMYSEAVRELRAQMNGKSQGAAYFLVRRIQEVTAGEVERISFAVADAVHERLAGLSVAACINPLPGEDVEPDVQMVLNSAYLVADAVAPTLQAAVDALVTEHGDNGFRFQLSGPWPAYNFVAMAPELVRADDGA